MQLKWPMLWDLFSLFPAHAGVIPNKLELHEIRRAFPRTRGGDPCLFAHVCKLRIFSPHTRG